MNKSIWSKLTKIGDDKLSVIGCEIEVIEKEKPAKSNKNALLNFPDKTEDQWLPQVSEGKLSVDVCLDDKHVMVVSAIAGVKAEDLEILIDRDVLTLKGDRKKDFKIEEKNYLHQECFWGSFSRTVLLPCEVKTEEVKANLKNGILTVILPIKGELKEREAYAKVKITKK